MRYGVYERYAEVPYALEHVPGAEHLIVSFPGLTAGAAAPLVEVRHRLGELRAHRLYVGADRDFLVGPDLQLAGARTATHLIWRTADELGLAPADVTAVGSSFRALCALQIGLKARVGRIIAGGPPVRMGSWILRLRRSLPPTSQAGAMRDALAQLTGVEDPARRDLLDRLILRAVHRADHPGEIDLFGSPDDEIWRETTWLCEQLAGHPTLRSTLTAAEYGGHDAIKVPFFAFVQQTLRPVTGTCALPPLDERQATSER